MVSSANAGFDTIVINLSRDFFVRWLLQRWSVLRLLLLVLRLLMNNINPSSSIPQLPRQTSSSLPPPLIDCEDKHSPREVRAVSEKIMSLRNNLRRTALLVSMAKRELNPSSVMALFYPIIKVWSEEKAPERKQVRRQISPSSVMLFLWS